MVKKTIAVTLFVGSCLAASKPELRVESVSVHDPCRGLKVKKGDVVLVNHKGFVVHDDGTKQQFDSNCQGVDDPVCEPLEIQVGAKRVIKGMERALAGLCQGDVVEAYIPPHLGYDMPGREIPDDKRPVPVGTNVMYEIHVVSIERPGEASDVGNALFGLELWQLGVAATVAAIVVTVAIWSSSGDSSRKSKKQKKKKTG